MLVTTAGGVEEDLIKCMAPTYLGDFRLKGAELRRKGLNRIGNMLVPNSNYCAFEEWIMPILDAMLAEQRERNVNWTPSKVPARHDSRSTLPLDLFDRPLQLEMVHTASLALVQWLLLLKSLHCTKYKRDAF